MNRTAQILIVSGFTILVALLGATSESADAQNQGATPQQIFDGLFSKSLAESRTKRLPEDRLAINQRLYDTAKILRTDAPEVAVLCCKQVLELSTREPDFASPILANSAYDLWKTLSPRGSLNASLARLNYRKARYDISRGQARFDLMEPLVRAYVETGNRYLDAGQGANAGKMFNEALKLATFLNAETEQIQMLLDEAKDVAELDGVIALLEQRIKSEGDSQKVLANLVTLLLVEKNDPARAAQFAKALKDEKLQRVAILCAQPLDELKVDDLYLLAEWWTPYAKSDNLRVRRRALTYAIPALAKFSELQEPGDARGAQVRLSQIELNENLKELEKTLGERIVLFTTRTSGIVIEVLVDGKSELHITPQGLYWNNLDGPPPGADGRTDHPTYINGKAWKPTWDNRLHHHHHVGRSDLFRLPIDRFDFEIAELDIRRTRGGRPSTSAETDQIVVDMKRTNDGQVLYIYDRPGFSRWYKITLKQ